MHRKSAFSTLYPRSAFAYSGSKCADLFREYSIYKTHIPRSQNKFSSARTNTIVHTSNFSTDLPKTTYRAIFGLDLPFSHSPASTVCTVKRYRPQLINTCICTRSCHFFSSYFFLLVYIPSAYNTCKIIRIATHGLTYRQFQRHAKL